MNGEDNIYSKITTDSSLKLRTALIILAVIASAMAVLFVLHAEADSSSAQIVDNGQCGPTAYYYYDSDGTLVIYGAGAVYDYRYTDTPWNAYSYKITKIIIGDSITHLGEAALAGCTHAKELTMPITLNATSSDIAPAFAGDYCFEKITFTCGNDGYGFDYAAYSGNNAWYQNTPWYLSRACLKEIVFTDGVTHIGSDAFRELNLTKLVLPDSVTSLGCHCFFNCTELTELTIPVSLNSYGNADYPAFQGCTAVEKVTFTRGNGVPFDYYDWWHGYYHCDLAPWNLNSSVAKTIVISDDVSRLGRYMFYFCNIKDLTIPVNISICGCEAFMSRCDNLEKVTLTKGTGAGCDYDQSRSDKCCPWTRVSNIKTIIVEEGVTHIGSYTFDSCYVGELILPNSLTSFGKSAFITCHIKDLTIPISLNAVWLDSYPAFKSVSEIEKITFTPGSGYGFNYAAYEDINCWYQHTPWYQCRGTLKEIVFEDGIKSIGSDAFRELNLTSLVIPDSVVSLGNHTFYNCGKLTDLTLPITLDSVYSAKYPAFEGCYGIINLRLTAGTDGVGFNYQMSSLPIWCTPDHRLHQLTVDSGISYIGDYTFQGYRFIGLDSRTMPAVAENLSGHIFVGEEGLLHQTRDVPDNSDDVSVTGRFAEPADRAELISAVEPDPVVKSGMIFEHDLTVGQDILAISGLTECRY